MFLYFGSAFFDATGEPKFVNEIRSLRGDLFQKLEVCCMHADSAVMVQLHNTICCQLHGVADVAVKIIDLFEVEFT